MRAQLNVLNHGSCESLKAGVHAAALGLAALMGAYNAAAWLRRGEPHLAINAVLYAALTAWEGTHVAHHFASLREADDAKPVRPVGAPETGRVAPHPPTKIAA